MNPRNKAIIFRLTEAEFGRLRLACAAAGSRSLSDFTRSSVLALIESESVNNILQDRFLHLEEILNGVQKSLAAMAERFPMDDDLSDKCG